MGIEHPCRSRISNKRVLLAANNLDKTITDKGVWSDFRIDEQLAHSEFDTVTEVLKRKRRALLGHLLRSPNEDPMRLGNDK